MELILGMRPMSQFDAAATPMYRCFHPTPDTAPYLSETPQTDLNERNTKVAWGADKSRKLNFRREDAADDLALNEIIWRSVRGPASRMPAPIRAAFVFANPSERDDD
jgi:hypothetical protein